MERPRVMFVIPTYRLRDVGDTIEEYDRHFWVNGHYLDILVFDDSSTAVSTKYYKKLEETKTYNDVFYIGPYEKGRFLDFLHKRLKDKKYEPLINNLFRPSYGGNRNFTLMYTLGSVMISSDDDMRPDGLIMEDNPSLNVDEVCRGRLVRIGENGYCTKSYDILSSFLDVLAKKVKDVPGNYHKGEYLIDDMMDLETNRSQGLKDVNSVFIKRGKVSPNSIIKLAQTFRTGTNDIDALDFAEMFLNSNSLLDARELDKLYVIDNFRPAITDKNWRMDCGVAGYDNRYGLPPFFPTRLRFEDFIYRLWAQQSQIATAHVNSVQRHIKSSYMREHLTSDIFNEEIANFLKKKIKSGITRLDDLTIHFDYYGDVTQQDSKEILDRMLLLNEKTLAAINSAQREDRKNALRDFSANLTRTFYQFDPDFFQENLSRLVDDEIGLIRSALQIWRTLIEICYYQKDKQELPKTKVKNKRRTN